MWLAAGCDDPEAAVEAGRALAANGDAESACALLDAQLGRGGPHARVLAARGGLELAGGDAAAAQATFEAALALDPQQERAAVGLAELLTAAGDHTGAHATLERAFGVGGVTAADAARRAEATGTQGGAGAAIALARARAAHGLGRAEEALGHYAAAFRLTEPSAEDALAAAADALAAPSSARAEVVTWLARASRLQPNRADLFGARAAVLAAEGRLGPAIDAAHRALELEPGDGEAAVRLVELLNRAGRSNEADGVRDHALRLELPAALRERLRATPPDSEQEAKAPEDEAAAQSPVTLPTRP